MEKWLTDRNEMDEKGGPEVTHRRGVNWWLREPDLITAQKVRLKCLAGDRDEMAHLVERRRV